MQRIISFENERGYLESINQVLKSHSSKDYSKSIEVNNELLTILDSVEQKVQYSLWKIENSIALVHKYCPHKLDDFKSVILDTFSEIETIKSVRKEISSPKL